MTSRIRYFFACLNLARGLIVQFTVELNCREILVLLPIRTVDISSKSHLSLLATHDVLLPKPVTPTRIRRIDVVVNIPVDILDRPRLGTSLESFFPCAHRMTYVTRLIRSFSRTMPLAGVRPEECVLRKRLHGKRAHACLQQVRTGNSDARRDSMLGVIGLFDKQRDRNLHVHAEW